MPSPFFHHRMKEWRLAQWVHSTIGYGRGVTPGSRSGPSAHAFALNSCGSILNTTGPAAPRSFAVR